MQVKRQDKTAKPSVEKTKEDKEVVVFTAKGLKALYSNTLSLREIDKNVREKAIEDIAEFTVSLIASCRSKVVGRQD